MKRLLFIFNPMAGRAKLNSHLLDIISFYVKNNYLVTMYCTQKNGDRYAFLRGVDKSYDLIVCAGGDGTLNEVISAFLDLMSVYHWDIFLLDPQMILHIA